METITCDGKRINVHEIEQIGGEAATDTLYRSTAGNRYFVKRERCTPLSPNVQYTMPRDATWVLERERPQVSVEELSEKEAMLWYTDEFLNDNRLRKRFAALIRSN